MDNKPFDRFNDKPVRGDRPNRFDDRRDRFSERRPRFSDDDAPRLGRRDSDFGERREFRRFGEHRDYEGRRDFGDRRNFGDRYGSEGFSGRSGFKKYPRKDFGKQSGTRAKVFDRQRYSDRTAFVKTATVRLAPDVAEYFKSADDVNAALRSLIALTELVRPAEKSEPEAGAVEATTLDSALEGADDAVAFDATAALAEDAAADEATDEVAGDADSAEELKA